jgi:hypothetical protein
MSRFTRRLQGALASGAALFAVLASAAAADAATRTFTGISATADGGAYVLMSDAGEAYAFGLPYRGGPVGFSGRIVGVSATASGQGYAAVSSTGQVYAYGNVVYRGNPTGFSGEIAGISVTADGSGYVVASTAGQVYAYNVPYRGNAVGFTGRITGVSMTASGSGYDLVSSAGQVYAFNTTYRGNPVGFSGEIVGISSTASGSGYYAISSAGQVYAYGTQYRGNPTGFTGRIVGISAKADGSGYAALSSSGQVYGYGTAYRGNGDPGSPDAPPTPSAPSVAPAPDEPPVASGLPPLLTQKQIRRGGTVYGNCNERGGKVTCPTVKYRLLALPASFAVPSGQRKVQVNAAVYEAFRRAVVEIDRAGLGPRVKQFQTVNRRPCRRVSGGIIAGCVSMHSWGLAVDINPGSLNATRDGQSLAGVRRIFKSIGFIWGASFRSNVDPPHFQWAKV